MHTGTRRWLRTMALLPLAAGSVALADRVDVSLAGTRTHFSTAEGVELAVLYSNDGGNARSITVAIRHADGALCTAPVPVDAAGGKAQTRLLTLDPGALKPGTYTAAAEPLAGGQTATFAVHPAEPKNPYYTGQWVHQGGTVENALAKGGWMYMTTDYVSLHPRQPKPGDLAEGYVAASMRPFALMVCGGGHQLDLELVNDWGDPAVQRAVAWRTQLAALSNRIYPIAGSHLYDEPGLTWWPVLGPDGKSRGTSPFVIPHQLAEFKKLTGKDMPEGTFDETLPKYAAMMPDWLAFMEMRMKYLEQCWYASAWGTKSVAPQFLTVNQVSSSYAPHDITDGVDSRQNRPYDVLSGHGQYSDLPFGTLQPLRAAESYQGFAWDKPHLYLPMWYTHTWASIRAAIWVSWASKLEGMLYTPEQDFGFTNALGGFHGSHTIFEIAEINRRLAMVGGVMSQLPKTLAPVAILQSHTQAAWDIATQNTPTVTKLGAPPYASRHREAVNACFFRVLETGLIPNVVDEVEVVEKGAAFLKQWPVVFCPALTYATPAFLKVLDDYCAGGGKLIQFADDKLVVGGAVRAAHTFGSGTEYYMTRIVANTAAANAAKKAGDSAAEAKAARAGMEAGTDLAWRGWNMAGAPTFAADLAGWVGPRPYASSNPAVLLGVHRAGDAHYLLLANNAQSIENPRLSKHELIPAETTVKLPVGGVVYDLFNGGALPVQNGAVALRLAAGDGACLLHLPEPPGTPKLIADVDAEHRLAVTLEWGRCGYLPFRLRVLDPNGKVAGDYFRATTPERSIRIGATVKGPNRTRFQGSFPLGINATPGYWTVEVEEWLTGTKIGKSVTVKPPRVAPLAAVVIGDVSVYFDDTQRISSLFAGKPLEPDWLRLNWDAPRVFGPNPKKFAVFATEPDLPAANGLADALRGNGMAVEVNPPYAIKPLVREPNRGGSGPAFRLGNFEDIYAHTIVLPGHKLADQSRQRGHINRPVTPAFPGPGRAAIQWGISCYQMGYQNIFVAGDTAAGVTWLIEAMKGMPASAVDSTVRATVIPVTAAPSVPRAMQVSQQVRTYDTPVGVGSSPDGARLYAALYDGSVAAYDAKGAELWKVRPLLVGGAIAVSPKGDRLAVGGYPGLLVLDTATGRELGGWRAEPKALGHWVLGNQIGCIAWNAAGTKVAGGWVNGYYGGKPQDAHDVVLLDAEGKVLPSPKDIPGNVYGVAFVPGTADTLLVGADKLTAVHAADGSVLWSNDLGGAQAFAFSLDGTTAAAGGWGKRAGTFQLADGKLLQSAKVDAIIGGVALTPAGELVVAVWGGTKPLYAVRTVTEKDKAGKDVAVTKPVPLFQSQFAFQSVVWSPVANALVAAEQGGAVWVLAADGAAKTVLDIEAGTTAYRCVLAGNDVLLARMNRVVQRVPLK